MSAKISLEENLGLAIQMYKLAKQITYDFFEGKRTTDRDISCYYSSRAIAFSALSDQFLVKGKIEESKKFRKKAFNSWKESLPYLEAT